MSLGWEGTSLTPSFWLLQAVTSGANPIAIKKGIDKTCDFLVQKLRENAKPVQGTQDIKVTHLFHSPANHCQHTHDTAPSPPPCMYLHHK